MCEGTTVQKSREKESREASFVRIKILLSTVHKWNFLVLKGLIRTKCDFCADSVGATSEGYGSSTVGVTLIWIVNCRTSTATPIVSPGDQRQSRQSRSFVTAPPSHPRTYAHNEGNRSFLRGWPGQTWLYFALLSALCNFQIPRHWLCRVFCGYFGQYIEGDLAERAAKASAAWKEIWWFGYNPHFSFVMARIWPVALSSGGKLRCDWR